MEQQNQTMPASGDKKLTKEQARLTRDRLELMIGCCSRMIAAIDTATLTISQFSAQRSILSDHAKGLKYSLRQSMQK